MPNRTQIHKKASSHFTPTPATGMFQPRPFAEPVQPETATPEVQTKIELGNIESDRLSRMSVETQHPVDTGNFASGQAPPIQPKLTIGAPGDKYEQEADTIARKVVQQISAPTPPDANPNGDDGSVQRQFSAPSISRLVVQRREAVEGGEASSSVESTIGQARSSGVPLGEPIRRQMEGAFGADFSGVRIHANNTADTLNRQLSSRAFTTGNNIFFKRGEYDPGSSGGQELLAHELTHVVQQGRSLQQAIPAIQRRYDAANYDPIKRKVTDASRAKVLEKIVARSHWSAISEICKKHHYTIAIRETGVFSIKRIEEGAKAKPHSILEKSIKPSSINKKYGNENTETILQKVKALDLDGFVGHWNDTGLVGVRIDNPPEHITEQGIVQPCDNGGEFVRVDLNAPDGGSDLVTLKKNSDWKKYLYTGDYDLHEAYQARGGGGGQIPEATKEKIKLLNRLNAGIVKVDQSRTGTMGLHDGILHKENGSDYAMFQHGDQATYRMNQRLEANAKPKKKKVASLVRSVAIESDEPLGWCRYGSWYVTMNLEEHDQIRKQWGLVKPHTWSKEEDERTKNNQMRTARYRD